MHGAMHWTECRRFSLPEFKRFGSFPDEFTFAGAFEEGIRQVGNSVPPLFMRAIARHIRFVMLPAARREDAAA
jgi:DNA (cytosine-5)-methyltransferase 1